MRSIGKTHIWRSEYRWVQNDAVCGRKKGSEYVGTAGVSPISSQSGPKPPLSVLACGSQTKESAARERLITPPPIRIKRLANFPQSYEVRKKKEAAKRVRHLDRTDCMPNANQPPKPTETHPRNAEPPWTPGPFHSPGQTPPISPLRQLLCVTKRQREAPNGWRGSCHRGRRAGKGAPECG